MEEEGGEMAKKGRGGKGVREGLEGEGARGEGVSYLLF